MAPRQRCGEVKAIVEIAFMSMFHPVSLHTFIIEQQPRVKNSYLVSTSSYLKHQISNIHNIPLVGPQEMPGGRKHVILNQRISRGKIYNTLALRQHLEQTEMGKECPEELLSIKDLTC